VAQKNALEHRVDAVSGGAEAAGLAPRAPDLSRLDGSPLEGVPGAFVPGVTFLAYNFVDNGTETGSLFIPPDPIGAAGTDRVIAVVNVGIECRNKTGTLIFRDALRDFFSPLGAQTLGTFTFDPKIVYDHYENRFVVVALERWFAANGDPSDESRILVAVSKTSSPATATGADWWYMAIDSKVNIGGSDHWADYPGFEVDEEAVYITANMFPFSSGSGGNRLWIIDKGVAAGFYAGGAPSWNIYDPIPAGYYAMTLQPALIYGAGGAGAGIGTWLVGYSSLTVGGPGAQEAVQIIRIDNPLGAVSFTGEFVFVGDLEDVGGGFGFPAIPDAPQAGTATLIEVNDSRALDAVWRNNSLWVTTTINPNAANDAVNQGSATAHWFRFDTSAVPSPITVLDQGNIGGEDIAANTWTFFPSVAVNGNGDAKFGFAASAQTIYGGAYYAGREAGDPAGTVQASGTVQAGVDYYIRTFGGPRNRWGDYSGAAVDPSDDTTFWIFNQYAMTRGTATADGDGRWGTAWASCLVQSEDFGDAPDQPYPTLLASNGARHAIVAGVYMGTQIDAEPDGQPTAAADGDDINNLPDEDGVAWVTPLIPGQPAQVDVTVSISGWLDAWIDFNQSGAWDPGELIYSGGVSTGLTSIGFPVPGGALIGTTYARFRYNVSGLILAPSGPAPDGEVEDYRVFVEEPVDLDYGDAPDQPYPTLLANNGARHVINPNVFMGALIDAEFDGQPDPNAKGDDINNLPDEDGVNFVTPLYPGNPAQVDVIVSVNGWLDFWFDFDQSGTWDAAELMFSGPVVAGLNSINFNVPAAAVPGAQVFSRFRYNTNGPLAVTGLANDGEVEDYESIIEEEQLDFGDAPDQPYPTLLANNGARHPVDPAVFMGNLIDTEPDGQPTPAADGDDLANLPDEDGVTFVTPLLIGQAAQVDVVVSAVGWLDVWFDFNQNGSWLDPGELVYSGNVVVGNNPIGFAIPGGLTPGPTYARFRYNVGGAALTPDGLGPIGEVEDYEVTILEPVEELDFGDAPDGPYPTLLANNGARHIIVGGVYMGALIDAEADGQPTGPADGDDLATSDDEDGVVFTTPLVPYSPATVDVTVSVSGLLDAWIDFDANGVWDASEQIFASQPVAAGLNSLNFNVPLTGSQAFNTYARFRFSLVGGLAPDGLAPQGEVEDYRVIVEDDPVTDAEETTPRRYELYNAVPNPFNPQTTISFALPEASHIKLTVFDVQGHVIATLLNEDRGPGVHDIVWNGRDNRGQVMASGVYLYRIEAGSFVETKRMVLLK
jgi:hypothetical protein